ncbi:arginyl-tRNA synthetase [Hesseltinella vesiculosa]|uniref:arginine--tRNA ligase n=1 Tax=Hesseltinella vesiculosa TaxID=101127 RepID=A0A1X2GWB5_9FUNG|nr:arginyl-tRNA synthetase [Hesseltinella vesiculosa]
MNAAQLVRDAISKQIAKHTSCSEAHIARFLGMPKPQRQNQFTLPLPRLQPFLSSSKQQDLAPLIQSGPWLEKVDKQGAFLQFSFPLSNYIKHTLHQVYDEQNNYGCQQPCNKTVLIDYSSPNIAKPFHAGHLRSTILGNFIHKIHKAMGFHAIGINYLGDWGKQYGLLAVGYEKYGDENLLARDPIQHLYQVYVAINKDVLNDNSIDVAANQYFQRMEHGDEAALAQWRCFRELSIDSYRGMYDRLGIQFDEYAGESMAEPLLSQVYERLDRKGLLQHQDDGRWLVDLEALGHEGLGRPVLRRQDGTSLYLTRDLASLLLRQERHGFDKAVYVIGAEQSLHMKQLFAIWRLMTGDERDVLHHAGFGRVQGMSTRKGTVVFLEDILDVAQETMLGNMQQDETKYQELLDQGITANSPNGNTQHLTGSTAVDFVADKLGASAVIIQDVAAKRIKNYTFAWDRMTQARGYTGVFLQFTHARLCGIERHAPFDVSRADDIASLVDSDAAVELALTISQYPDIVQQSYETMEPSTLVQYLFRLAHSTGQATSSLRVKDIPDVSVAQSRLLLFSSAKTTLANGLRLLGIEPLERI